MPKLPIAPSNWKSLLLPFIGLLFVFVLFTILIAIFEPDNLEAFLSSRNAKTFITQTVIVGIGALGMSLVGMLQMMLNMFGLDRQAFRAYVLMPASRRDILLGKNMGIFPITVTLSALLIIFVGIVAKLHFTHVVASLLQIVVTFSLYFTVSNFISISAPIGMATGTMKPVSMNFSVIAMQFLAILLVPVAILPAALALAAELLANTFGGIHSIPIYLLITLIQLPFAVWYYHTMLRIQGRHLQNREQAILDVIAKVAN